MVESRGDILDQRALPLPECVDERSDNLILFVQQQEDA